MAWKGLIRLIKLSMRPTLVAFNNQIDAKLKGWQVKMAPYKGAKIIAYHNEWVYFETRFGLQIVDFMEPKPGIPPSPSQLVKVIKEIKADNIKVIVSSPYFTHIIIRCRIEANRRKGIDVGHF